VGARAAILVVLALAAGFAASIAAPTGARGLSFAISLGAVILVAAGLVVRSWWRENASVGLRDDQSSSRTARADDRSSVSATVHPVATSSLSTSGTYSTAIATALDPSAYIYNPAYPVSDLTATMLAPPGTVYVDSTDLANNALGMNWNAVYGSNLGSMFGTTHIVSRLTWMPRVVVVDATSTEVPLSLSFSHEAVDRGETEPEREDNVIELRRFRTASY
jgi:hypothetical protein